MANSRCQVAKGILKPDPFWIWQYEFTYSFPTECDWIHEGNGSRRDQPILWPLAFVTSKPAFVRSRISFPQSTYVATPHQREFFLIQGASEIHTG